MTLNHSLTSRFLAGFGTVALLAGIGLMASRPAHSVGGPVAVSVANSPLTVLSQDSDNPARHAVGNTIDLSSATIGASQILYTVPANKRLVIEHLSASTDIRNDPNGYNIEVDTVQGGGSVRTFFDEVPDAAPYSATSQSVRLYGDPGMAVQVTVYPGNKNAAEIAVSFSGYLEDK